MKKKAPANAPPPSSSKMTRPAMIKGIFDFFLGVAIAGGVTPTTVSGAASSGRDSLVEGGIVTGAEGGTVGVTDGGGGGGGTGVGGTVGCRCGASAITGGSVAVTGGGGGSMPVVCCPPVGAVFLPPIIVAFE